MKPESFKTQPFPSHTLPSGTILNQKYRISSVLGEGGFGITYAAYNMESGDKVAIKEYFPAGLVTREYHDGIPFVSHFQGQLEISFKKGLKRFQNEAAALKTFHNLSNLISIEAVFEENGTAYFVMEYIEGITLKHFIEQNGPLSFDELFPLMVPILEALDKIHKKGIIHRDISPDNLMLSDDNQLHLIDFGAFSLENPNETKTMTVILKAGYAPPEQYLSDGKVGAWTDVYGVCATIYMALTGAAPQEAIRRIQKDTLKPPYPNTAIRQWQSNALMKGLALDIPQRFRSVEKLYEALTLPPSLKEAATVSIDTPSIGKTPKKDRKSFLKSHYMLRKLPIFLTAIAVILFTYTLVKLPTGSLQNQKSDTRSVSITTDTFADATSEAVKTSTSSDEILTMINMVNSPLKHAKAALKELDSSITIKTQKEYDNTHDKGYVIAQSIEKQTQFTRGQITQIVLTVSKGKEPATQAPSTTAASNTSTSKHPATTQAPKNNTKDNDYKVNGVPDKKDYTTIHLE